MVLHHLVNCSIIWISLRTSLVPRLLYNGGGKRLWYTLFAHAPSSLGNLHSTPLHKVNRNFCLLAERPHCKIILVWCFIIVGRAWASSTLTCWFVIAQSRICHAPVDIQVSPKPTAKLTVKSWAEFLTLISAVSARALPEVTSTSVVIEICTACGKPAVDDL